MKIPKYQTIITWIESLIAAQKILPHQKLPSLRSVQNQFGVSLSVVVQAYQELEIKGIIQSKARSGYLLLPADQDFPSYQAPLEKIRTQIVKPHSLIGRIIELGLDPTLAPFACGMPDQSILPVKKVSQSLQFVSKNHLHLIAEYSPAKGSKNLRKHLAKRFISKGVQVDPEEILITSGAIEALSLALKTCTSVDDLVAIESPGFFGILPILESLHRKVIEIPVNPEKGLCVDLLAELLKTHPIKVLMVSGTVQNPTGALLTENRKKALINLAEKHDFWIVEDNVYGECAYQQELVFPLKKYDTQNRVLYVSSLSKSTAAGLRIGWMLPGPFLNQIEHIKTTQTLGQSPLLQEAAAHFMETGGYRYHLRRFRKAIELQVMAYRQVILDSFPAGTRVSKPQGGFFLWIELPTQVNTRHWILEAIQHKLTYVPGALFTLNSQFDSFLRISCTTPFSPIIQNQLRQLGRFFQRKITEDHKEHDDQKK